MKTYERVLDCTSSFRASPCSARFPTPAQKRSASSLDLIQLPGGLERSSSALSLV